MRATWLGSWAAPWPLRRGRRYGDPAWTLAAVTRAWLAGGREGHWPRGAWVINRALGPCPVSLFGDGASLPDPAWVALLRHGSGAADPLRPARGERPLETWAWEALLLGDAGPWLSSGSIHLDLETRLRWIPLLAGVEDHGLLRLPSFLECLIPAELHQLPPGWWESLLGSQDGQGRLLPTGALPTGLPWETLLAEGGSLLQPLLLDHLPEGLQPGLEAGWVQALPGPRWMLDPKLRAWGRGWAASPEALRTLRPQLFSLGGEPDPHWVGVLDGGLSISGLSDPWREALVADREGRPVSGLPPLSGEPTLDRIRVRWGGELPEPSIGYPAWGEQPHPCADPFHWMAEGLRAHGDQDLEGALRAFTLAHAHFLRLGSTDWARRAASNAAVVALRWCDLPGVQAWQRLQGPLPEFHHAHLEAELRAARGEWAEAARLTRRTLKRFPEQPQAWALLGEAGLFLRRIDWVQEALTGVEAGPFRDLLRAWIGGMRAPAPAGFPSEERLLWECARMVVKADEGKGFWSAWEACRSQVLRLHTGLLALESRPEFRLPGRLVALQALADRAMAPLLQERMKALWPSVPGEVPDPDPAALIATVLRGLSSPVWIAWEGPDGGLRSLGSGPSPTEGLLARVLRGGGLAPTRLEHRLLWGFPLRWEGVHVGAVLMELDPTGRLEAPAEVHALAPWLAKLRPDPPVPPRVEVGQLLTDGSEPMASILRELDQVAGTELPVLILGPTGSGKELMARELHRRSGRTGELVPVNCSAFAETLLESELFGHVKGAFTGADRDRKGAIEQAEGGTLFLDEVADLSPRLQSLFLRVLQERELRRVGSERSRKVDVRFLAATHKSMEELVRSGLFRRDLLFRLQGSVLELPGLEARRHEFPYLVPRLLAQAAQRLKRPVPALAPGLPEALARRPWPGNFRELGHALERAVLRGGPGPLKAEHFPELEDPELLEGTWGRRTQDFQRRLLRATLQRHGFRMTEAAQFLGLTRVALYSAAKRLGLDLALERQRWEMESGKP